MQLKPIFFLIRSVFQKKRWQIYKRKDCLLLKNRNSLLQKDELLREQAHESRKVQLKDDVQLPLKVEHYRKKFEALLVYEEEEHSNLLAEKFVLYVFFENFHFHCMCMASMQ